jgi:hypothetical protein
MFLACLTSLTLEAQEFLGVRNSNYAGIQSVFLNPSAITGSKLPWDFNVFSEGNFFDNNFFYAPKGSIPPLGFKKTISWIIHEDLFYTHFDGNNPNKLYQVAVSNEIIGPSFFLSLNNKNQIGFTYAVRGYGNIQNVPGHLAQNAFDDLQNKSLWNKPWSDSVSRMNSIGWIEYGLHYSRLLYRENKHQWKAGVSLNLLQGIGSAFTNNTNLHYTVADSSKVILTHSSLDFGGTHYYPNFWPSGAVHGSGISGSLGVTYVFTKDPNTCPPDKDKEWRAQPEDRYTLRIGVSMLDVGTIQFNRNSATYHLASDSAVYSGLGPPTHSQLNRTLTDLFNQNDSLKHRVADHFNMALPAAISLQADWNIHRQFYLNATLIKGIGHGNQPGVVRPDIYALVPRYETEWFEVSMPFSLLHYQYWQSRLGLAFRIGYFFFGADAPGGVLALKDFERADVYAGIRIYHLGNRHHDSTGTPCPPPAR